MKLFFCKDGVLRLYSNEHTPMLPCTFVQEEMDLVGDDFVFFSRFLNKEATFEKGLTFQTFLRCISPWVEFWSIYSQVDLVAYLEYVNKPHLQKKKSYIDSVEFSTYINVESGLSYIMDNKIVRAEDVGFLNANFASKFEPTLALGAAFNIESLFYLRGYNNSIVHFSFDITHTPIYEYMYAPLTIRKVNNIMFSEDGAKSIMELKGKAPKKQPSSDTLVFSKKFPGAQRMVSGDEFEDESYSYVGGEHIFSLEEIMREMFRFMPFEPLVESNPYSDIIHKSFELNKEYEDNVTREEFSHLIGDTIELILEETFQKITSVESDSSTEEKSIEKEHNQNSDSQAKILNLHPQNTSKDKPENIFTKPNKDTKVLSLQDFRDKKEKESHQDTVSDNSNDDIVDEDQEVILHMVEQARIQNIPLQDAFTVQQNHQSENRVMGILQDPLFETFDPITFIEEMDEHK